MEDNKNDPSGGLALQEPGWLEKALTITHVKQLPSGPLCHRPFLFSAVPQVSQFGLDGVNRQCTILC